MRWPLRPTWGRYVWRPDSKEAYLSHRLQVTVADDVADELERRGAVGGQFASRVAAKLIDLALNGNSRPTHRSTAASDRTPGRHVAEVRPPWLEPLGPADRRRWRSEMWAMVLDLYARYPRQLGNLEGNWWQYPARIEQLGAFVAWRSQIDDGRHDVREELCFQADLEEFRRQLDQTPGVGGGVFQPGVPPAEWLDPDTGFRSKGASS